MNQQPSEAESPETPSDPTPPVGTTIGGVSLTGVSAQQLTTGPISSQASAGRDIVAGDLHYHLYGDSVKLPDAKGEELLATAQAWLEKLPLETVPEPALLPPGSLLPFLANPLFVGRAEELKRL